MTDTSDREIVHSRLLNAPRELVYEAFTNPEHVAQWWGPNGFTNTIHEMDVRPGGVWRFIMHGPNGTDYPNRIVFTTVQPPELLVYEHGSDIDDDPHRFHVTTTFEDQDGKTLITLRLLCSSVEQCEERKKFGAVEGGRQTLARLEEYLTTMR